MKRLNAVLNVILYVFMVTHLIASAFADSVAQETNHAVWAIIAYLLIYTDKAKRGVDE